MPPRDCPTCGAPLRAKVCGRCRRRLPLTAYHEDPLMRTGLDSWCRACRAAYGRDRYAGRLDRRRVHQPIKDSL